MQNYISIRYLTSQIPFRADGELVTGIEVANARIGGRQISNRLIAVIDHDQLFVRVILPEKIFDRLNYELTPVSSGHNARNKGF
jgi:hypothetical protein